MCVPSMILCMSLIIKKSFAKRMKTQEATYPVMASNRKPHIIFLNVGDVLNTPVRDDSKERRKGTLVYFAKSEIHKST